MADGPIIQASSQRALDHGMTLRRTLDLIREARLSTPVVLFTYLNPLLAAGQDVLTRAATSGASGVLVTDLPVGADPVREEWLGSGPLAFVRLVAPTTPLERMREIASHGSGFVYLISRRGVTGLRTDVPAELPERSRDSGKRRRCRCALGSASRRRSRRRPLDGSRMASSSECHRASGRNSVNAAVDLVSTLRRALDEV